MNPHAPGPLVYLCNKITDIWWTPPCIVYERPLNMAQCLKCNFGYAIFIVWEPLFIRKVSAWSKKFNLESCHMWVSSARVLEKAFRCTYLIGDNRLDWALQIFSLMLGGGAWGDENRSVTHFWVPKSKKMIFRRRRHWKVGWNGRRASEWHVVTYWRYLQKTVCFNIWF